MTRLRDTPARWWLQRRLPQAAKAAAYRLAGREYALFTPGVVRRRAIFIHVPKTGGTAIKAALDGEARGGHHRLVEFYADDPDRAARFLKVGFVRNPWDRFVSAFAYLKSGQATAAHDDAWANRWLAPFAAPEELAEAMEDPGLAEAVLAATHFRPQLDWITLDGRTPALDHMGRFERLETDWAAIAGRMGAEGVTLDRLRPSRHASHRAHISPAAGRRLADHYGLDAEVLGYAY